MACERCEAYRELIRAQLALNKGAKLTVDAILEGLELQQDTIASIEKMLKIAARVVDVQRDLLAQMRDAVLRVHTLVDDDDRIKRADGLVN